MNFKFKKKLGQHFLKDKEILRKIISIKNLKNRFVIEIGPGNGALTKYILKENPNKLVIIEKDITLKPYLMHIKDQSKNKIEIFFDDILNFKFKELKQSKIILLANLPYNIATTIIIKLIKEIKIFESIIVMVQKEVAERLCAEVSSSAYGRITVLLRLHCNIKKYFDVGPENFIPKPKVISSVIEIKPKKKSFFIYDKIDKLLKVSFKQRRKTIKNNLKFITPELEKKMVDCGINPQHRPQDISPEDYVKLSNFLIY